jgi:hypothetical protein
MLRYKDAKTRQINRNFNHINKLINPEKD